MQTESISISVSPVIGTVSGEYTMPSDCRCVMTLAHGAGAGMNHSFMVELGTRLAERGIGTLRFNFPFMEKGKGRPDVPAVAHQAIAAAIDRVAGDYPGVPLFVAGKSFGGRMSSQYMAGEGRPEVSGMVFYGWPLHPAGKPSVERAVHLKDVKVPMLFFQGTKDDLAAWDLIEGTCAELPLATLVKIDGANHMFKAGKKDVIGMLVDATAEWTAGVAKKSTKGRAGK